MLAGYTSGDWNGTQGNDDFAACKLDNEGALVWKWQVNHNISYACPRGYGRSCSGLILDALWLMTVERGLF